LIARTDFEGDPNVGAFAVITNEIVFTSPHMSKKSIDTLGRAFNVPLVQSTVASLDVVGLMSVANCSGLLLPYTTRDEELAVIKRSVDITVDWLDNKMTALGNIILANDNGAICHPDFDSKAIKKISDVLDVEVVPGTVAKLPIVGVSSVVTSQGAVVHPWRPVRRLNAYQRC